MTAKPMLRAYGYARVSNDDEGGNNASIAAQAAAIRDYAVRESIEVVEIFQELNLSGRNLQRKQFDRMIAQATAPERPVHVVIVFALSRFARRLLTQVVTEHRLSEVGVRLISITEFFADDANGKMMRSMIAVMNEKYALDASLFTRRDRRGNARNGYYNGGPVPLGYEARTVTIDGRKERRKLFVVEEEAAIVRLIYDLALTGLDGRPMGTRSIAAHLNANGYTLRGRPFFHSNVDGVLTRAHYAGSYRDRTADDAGVAPRPEDYIVVACPQIVSPDQAAHVAAMRARAAPRVTAPRVTNSPTLLTGRASCGEPSCGAGLTIRTGKSGGYAYYACNAKVTAGAHRCVTRSIRQEMLEDVVIKVLLDRILAPTRLRELLHHVLERSDAADTRRIADLDRVRRERVAAEARLRRLFELVEEGLTSPRDPMVAERLAEHRQTIAGLEATERSLDRQLATGPHRIDEDAIARFAEMIRARLTDPRSTLRKTYVQLFVSKVTLTNDTITIHGSKTALESALIHGRKPGTPIVPSFDREWCRLQDSNL